jgi:hypothetical protein
MKKLIRLLAIICALMLFPLGAHATDIKGTCQSSCSFHIHIANAHTYQISISWYGAGGGSGTPVVYGENKDESYSMAPGQYTIHAKYLDGSILKDAAYMNCGSQFNLSFTNHGACKDYNEAWVSITTAQ